VKRIQLLLLLGGCTPEFTQPMKLGGQTISPEALEAGRQSFMLNCYACHGVKGDGKGPASPGLRPPPRDFTLGRFKFAAVPAGTLPRDEDLLRAVKKGLHGTAMLAWEVPDEELKNIIQYIKTFAPVWKDEIPGDPIVPSPDPWGEAKKAEAVRRGEVLYHVTARCAVCHPNYVTKQSLADMTKAAMGTDLTEFRPDMYGGVAKDSDYGVKILPPDFLSATLRSVENAADLYRVIAAGVGGTAMPTWKGALPEQDLWALVYYVNSLVEMKDTPAARALREKLAHQPDFVPPPPPPEPAAAPKR
jgi:mono/diheme cytochrome c family protein